MKVVTIFILLLIIGITFTFCFFYIFFNLKEPENLINQRYRKYALSVPTLAKMLRLEQVGDARYGYMYKRGLPIQIHLFYQEGASLTEKTKNAILDRMQFVSHKYVLGTFEGPTILQNIPEKVNDQDLKDLRSTYAQTPSFFAKTIPLNIFVLNYYTPHPSYAGLVEDAYSIFLFKQAIENVAETEDTIPSLEISTILHEFGHLGGAEHVENPDCIMVDKVENLNFFNKIPTIRDSYCEEDLKQIQQALQF